MTAEIESVVITPVVCIFCKFSTYIEYDLELHLYENHKMGLRKLPISIPRGENSTDFRIEHAIKQGRMIGALDENSKQKLGLVFDKPKDLVFDKPKDLSKEFHIPIPIHDLDIQGVRTWSQVVRTKNSFTFMPVVSVEEFFENDPDKPYSALRSHSLEQSPCYPVIGARPAGRHTLYWCEIHQPEFGSETSIHLSSIEHHCKYKDPKRHKSEILARLEGCLK